MFFSMLDVAVASFVTFGQNNSDALSAVKFFQPTSQ